jgi:hypothetical protein
LSEAISAGQTGHVAAHNDIHDVVNEAARYNVANTFAAVQTFAAAPVISVNGGKTTLALTDTTADVGITIGGDTNLFRSAANTLKTDDNLTVGGATIRGDGASPYVWLSHATGATFGYHATAGNPPYFQAGANDLLVVSSDGGHIRLYHGASAGKVFIGGADTNIYRSAANELATDDILRFNAAGTFQTTVGAAGGGSALPATPTKYFKIKDEAGATFVVPCYAAS